MVWHERGRYEVLAIRHGVALGAQSREALHDTGFRFDTQAELCEHLFAIVRPLHEAAS